MEGDAEDAEEDDSFVESVESNEYQPDSLDGNSISDKNSRENFSVHRGSYVTQRSTDLRSTL